MKSSVITDTVITDMVIFPVITNALIHEIFIAGTSYGPLAHGSARCLEIRDIRQAYLPAVGIVSPQRCRGTLFSASSTAIIGRVFSPRVLIYSLTVSVH